MAIDSDLFRFYEGTEPAKYTPLTGRNLNRVAEFLNQRIAGGLSAIDLINSKIDTLPAEVEAKGTASGLLVVHDSDADSHEMLRYTVTEHRNAADAAATRAETALASVNAASQIYATTALGIAGTTDGKYFYVVSQVATGFIDLYKNVAGVAESQNKTLASQAKIDQLATQVSDLNITNTDEVLTNDKGGSVVYAVVDANGKSALSVSDSGDVTVGGQELVDSSASTPDMVYAITDEDDNLALGVNNKGNVETTSVELEELPDDETTIAWGVTDKDGKVALAVDFDGNTEVAGVLAVREDGIGVAFALTDEYGKAALIVYEDGKVELPGSDFSSGGEGGVVTKEYIYDHQVDILHFVTYGQSLSRGATSSPTLSNTQPYNSLMLNTGVMGRPITDGVTPTGFSPLIEQSLETPTAGTAAGFINQLIKDNGMSANQDAMALLGHAPGQGGRTLQQLHKGTTYWNDMMTGIQYSYDFSQAQNKSHAVHFMTWTQGENNYSINTTRTEYYDLMNAMLNDFTSDIKAINSQEFDPIIIMYQVAAHRRYSRDEPTIAYAHLDCGLNHPRMYLATPMYHLDYSSDNLHLTSSASFMLGRYYGMVAKKILVDKIDWKPLHAKHVRWQGKIIDVQLHLPHGSSIVLDTSRVTQALNYGFDLWDASNLIISNIIQSVSVVGRDRIRIVLNSTPPSGTILTYAKGRVGDPAVANRTAGPRGNFRDQQGDDEYYTDAAGSLVRLDNWLCMFNAVKP